MKAAATVRDGAGRALVATVATVAAILLCSLLRLFPREGRRHLAALAQALDRLESGGVGLAAHDPAGLGLHQVLLLEAAGGVVCRAVNDLGAGSDGLHGF